MVLTISHKIKLYRRFECDIWGYCYTDERMAIVFRKLKYVRRFKTFRPFWWRRLRYFIRPKRVKKLKSPYFNFFYKLWYRRRKLWKNWRKPYVYKFDYPVRWRYLRKFNYRFISIRLTKLYYLIFQTHQFRKMFRSAVKKDGNFETNYLRVLECRAVSIAYRLNFSPDIFWLMRFLKMGSYLLLEHVPIKTANFIMPIGRFFTVFFEWRWKIIKRLFKRIFLRTIMFPAPKFFFTSYECFYFYLVRAPRRVDLIYPFSIDLQRITGYY